MKSLFFLIAAIALTAGFARAQPAPTPAPSKSATPKSSPPPSAPAPAKAGKAPVALPLEKTQPVRMPRFDKPPVIDGKLDDEIWKQAVVLKDFYQVQPGDNIAPSKPTEVMLGYDPKFLYIAFHCYDEPDKVRATIPKRDDIWNDDYVGILFDTFNDHRKAYEFDFNPLGVQADGIWTDGARISGDASSASTMNSICGCRSIGTYRVGWRRKDISRDSMASQLNARLN